MTTPQGPHAKLIEPLQGFLESFTQELTEQKFIPAFRDELKRLLGALESLQQSEAALREIASGVDGLREVFAPAGAKLVEGLRDLETGMRANADQIRGQAAAVLKDLVETHEQLEGALRKEAGLLQEQSSATRETVARTAAEIEQRLSALTAQLEALCQRMESSASEIGSGGARPVEAPAPVPVLESVKVELPQDLRDLLTRSEETVVQELERHRAEIAATLLHGRTDDSERLARLDQKIAEALAAVGPRMQDELETAVSRLRDQIQALILAEVETRSAPVGEPALGGAVPADFTTALTASETRILREISALEKSQKGEQSEVGRVLRELAQGFDQTSQRYAERSASDGQVVRESLTALQRLLSQMRDSAQQDREQLTTVAAQIDALSKGHREHAQTAEREAHSTLGRLESNARILEQKVEEDRQLHAQLSAAVARAEQAATQALDVALADSRAQRDKIETSLKDLRERLDRGLLAEADRMQELLRGVAEAWTEALETLRDFVHKTLTSRTDSIVTRLDSLDAKMSDIGQSSGSVQKDLQGEIRRMGTVFDDRIEGLRTNTESFTTAMEAHVKAVSGEVAALRSKQEQSLAVLKEAIRANYDENAGRLKQVIETAYDTYIGQTASLPGMLDRFTHLIQSLHQGDQLALQAVASDTKNMLSLSNEKFELLLADNAAVKKYFPLLDKKLEKHATDIEALRRAQSQLEKQLADARSAMAERSDAQDEQQREVRSDLKQMQSRSEEQLGALRDDAAQLAARFDTLREDDLPAMRRESIALLTSKFEFMETTLRDRQEALRKATSDGLEKERSETRKAVRTVTLLVVASLALQIMFYLLSTPGAGK